MSVHLNVAAVGIAYTEHGDFFGLYKNCLLYTSDAADEL